MKKILITGKNSYIGTSFENWLAKNPDEYQVDTVGTRNDEWRDFDFSPYDVVFHVAGIAHIKETKKNEHLYYEVNRDLAYEISKKAKNEKVKHFILLSSMSVYGKEKGIINKKTKKNPKNAYGKSKLEAEILIEQLMDEKFKVSIIRPPMVYGKNCKGNYIKLAKLGKLLPFFPNTDSKRSMIYVDNLSEFLRIIIKFELEGVFCPQNEEYVNVSDIIKEIRELRGKKIFLINGLTFLLNLFSKFNTINKVFGNLYYEKELSEIGYFYNIKTFKDSIRLTEL